MQLLLSFSCCELRLEIFQGTIFCISNEACDWSWQPKEEKEEKGTRTLKLTEKFICRPADIFDVYTNQNRIMAFTQSPATFEPTVGGKFTMFDGSVVGKYLEKQSI